MKGLTRYLEQLKQHPQNIAIVAQERSLTYSELDAAARKLARRITETVFQTNQPFMGIAIDDGSGFYVAVLAVWMTGRAYVPLRLSDPVERNRTIVESLDLQYIILPEGQERQDVTEIYLIAISESDSRDSEPIPQTEIHLPASQHPAYILFTSGSTGVPKGVPIHWKQLDAFVSAVLDHDLYNFGLEDRFLQMFQPTFDLSVFSFWVPLCVGASIVVCPLSGSMAMNISYLLEEERISVALMTPSVLTYLQAYFSDLHLPDLRYSLFCGEALPHALTAEWANCIPNAQIENVYGPTEATIFCTRYVWQNDISKQESLNGIVPIGKSLPGTQLQLAAIDEPELILTGTQVSDGYWKNDDKTAQCFAKSSDGQNMYRTGDLCQINENGNYLFIGRKDSQIKIDGYRIEPGEIEHHAREITGVQQLVVLALQELGSYRLVLFVQQSEIPPNDWLPKLRERLPRYMHPQAIYHLAQFPLNNSGKIDRKQLLEQALMLEARLTS